VLDEGVDVGILAIQLAVIHYITVQLFGLFIDMALVSKLQAVLDNTLNDGGG